MPWVEGLCKLQDTKETLKELLVENGWKFHIKYRLLNEPTNVKKNSAEVFVFRSKGSDLQTRYLGIVESYGGHVRLPKSDEDIITQYSELGELEGELNGVNKEFQFKVFPVAADMYTIYIDDDEIEQEDLQGNKIYEVDGLNGIVTFTEAPTGSKMTATYNPAEAAPTIVKRLMLFTYESAKHEVHMLPSTFHHNATYLGISSGEPVDDNPNESFVLPTNRKIRNVVVHAGRINNYRLLANEIDFDIKREENDEGGWKYTLTFRKEHHPNQGDHLWVRYITNQDYEVDENGTIDYGDIISSVSFDPEDVKSVMNAVYSNVNMIRPSLPTSISFTPLSILGRGWQRDSGLFYWGNINKDRVALMFKPDVAADPLNCDFAPMYFGRVRTYRGNPRRNLALLAGTREQDVFLHPTNSTTPLQVGIYNVNYGHETGNGNKDVQLQQSIGGSMYQKHYFSYYTHDEDVDSSEGKFNPSKYSGKYHISPFSLVHPNDGVVGMLVDVFAVHPKNISQKDDLEIDSFKEAPYVEEFGRGDGERKIYYLTHRPSKMDSGEYKHFKLKVGCVEKKLGIDFEYDPDTSAIVFKAAPEKNEALVAEYNTLEVYNFTYPDTEVSPLNDPVCSPYTKIGWAILKETKPLLDSSKEADE